MTDDYVLDRRQLLVFGVFTPIAGCGADSAEGTTAREETESPTSSAQPTTVSERTSVRTTSQPSPVTETGPVVRIIRIEYDDLSASVDSSQFLSTGEFNVAVLLRNTGNRTYRAIDLTGVAFDATGKEIAQSVDGVNELRPGERVRPEMNFDPAGETIQRVEITIT